MFSRLGLAIHRGELERVRMYIEQGVNVNRRCYLEMYPLALACCGGHEEIMEELLKAGAHPNQVSRRCRQLAELGCVIEEEDLVLTGTAMFMAADKRVLTLSMARCLISHGADVDFRDDDGRTILHYLARGQFSDAHDDILSAAKLLLENGASFYARDKFDSTPLYLACVCRNIDLVKLFIAEGADVNFDIGRQMTMLRLAVYPCDIDMFDLLLNAGANRHIITSDDLIYPSASNDHAMIAKILDTCDVDINLRDRYGGMTFLHGACDDRHITSETVRLLLDRGADVRAVSDTGDTVLHYAAMDRDCNKIRQLLSYNPTLNRKNNDNQTPLLKLTRELNSNCSQSRQQVLFPGYYASLYQAGLLAFKMIVTAGAKVTADVQHELNKLRIKHREAQILVYKISSTRSLKEMCRFVIRGTILVPVDVSLYKLPITKLLQEYLNFPEFDQLVDENTIYLKIQN